MREFSFFRRNKQFHILVPCSLYRHIFRQPPGNITDEFHNTFISGKQCTQQGRLQSRTVGFPPDPKPAGMSKGKRFFCTFSDFIPETPDTESFLMFSHVMKKNDPTRTHFTDPGFKIVLYCFIRMKSVDVQQINTFILEFSGKIVKHPSQQSRKRCIVCLIMFRYKAINIFPVNACLNFPGPTVNRIAAGIQTIFGYRLTKRKIRISEMSSQFHESPGPKLFHQNTGKNQMPCPTLSFSIAIQGIKFTYSAGLFNSSIHLPTPFPADVMPEVSSE